MLRLLLSLNKSQSKRKCRQTPPRRQRDSKRRVRTPSVQPTLPPESPRSETTPIRFVKTWTHN